MMHLTVAYQEPSGYKYVETSDDLKAAAAALPCFRALEWPDYSTEIVEDTINGKKVVIQLWKGWCQQFLSSPNFPGGVGGEVGVYERVTGKGFPAERPDWCPQALWLFLQQKSKLANGDFWWPVAEMNEIEWNFINPVNNKIAFHAEPQKTYWRNKWMDNESYNQYQNDQGKRWNWLPSWFPLNSQTPKLAWNYVLEYKINGKSYPRW
jgi:hypothetical protein